MNSQAKPIAFVASLMALAGVVMAALGSHMIDLGSVNNGATIWQTAAMLHLFQVAAVLALSAWLQVVPSKGLQWACWTLLLGAVIFCGSLYLRVMSAGSVTGAAPLGGMIMMVGWFLASWSFAISFKRGS